MITVESVCEYNDSVEISLSIKDKDICTVKYVEEDNTIVFNLYNLQVETFYFYRTYERYLNVKWSSDNYIRVNGENFDSDLESAYRFILAELDK